MNVDARIAEKVHQHFTYQGVPVLSVHDSFIIDYTRVGELKRVMAEASWAVTGRELAVSASGWGVDEMEAAVRADFVSWAQTPRSSGYLQRLKGWEARAGREVVPYGYR
jgi:nucleoid-associated protein YejK